MSGRIHEQRIEVPFADMDMAKVLYFPRLFHYCHLAMEGWFAAAAGMPYHRVLSERNLGFPTVHAEADYFRTITYGLVLRALFSVRRVGRTSVDLRIRFLAEGEEDPRAEARSTVVCVAIDRFESVPVPEDLRRLFSLYLEEPA
jgi:acyl-CoA thioesterase FadM